MRVIHIVSSISDEASGATHAVVQMCKSLIAQGEEVTLAALNFAPIRCPPPFLRAFPLAWGPRRLGRSSAMRRWLDRQAISGCTHLIHNHFLWMMPNVYSGRVAKQHGVHLVVSPHGTLSEWALRNGSMIKRLFWPFVQRPALEATSCFHATAASEYEDIRRMGFVQPVAVIPIGVDIPDLLSKTPSEFRTLLFLGRIHPKKGLDMLLPAWQAVRTRFPEWRLRIVGPDSGSYLAQMQRLASELRLERIEFSGALLDQQKWQAYGQADLFVLPTYSENFGMAVAEALAAGTPAIVSKGAPWAGLEKHHAGWWFDVGLDPLVACLEDALSRSSTDLARMGLLGRNWMQKEYSWMHIGWQMAETYRWILQGGVKPYWILEK